LPILIGYSMPAWVAGVLVLGLNVGAYGAEVVRGGIESVSTGQHEAAIALGYSRHQKMRHIILPQAVPIILPPAGNLLIELMKVSALVSLITIPDLTFAAERIRDHTMQTGAIYGLALVLYFLIAMAISLGIQKLEKRFSFGKS
jgi:polar amino acid transport system permease protein